VGRKRPLSAVAPITNAGVILFEGMDKDANNFIYNKTAYLIGHAG